MTLMVKCTWHFSRIKPLMMTLPIQVSCRGMATQLKDYESHYDRLEIHPECTKTEIRWRWNQYRQKFVWWSILFSGWHLVLFNCREAWLRLSMQYHPDLNPDDEKAANRFLEIKESYTGLIRTLIWQFQCLIWSNISQSWSMMRKGKLTMTR